LHLGLPSIVDGGRAGWLMIIPIAALVTIAKRGRETRVLFDAGRTPDGLVELLAVVWVLGRRRGRLVLLGLCRFRGGWRGWFVKSLRLGAELSSFAAHCVSRGFARCVVGLRELVVVMRLLLIGGG
jgi:hypothetical protein